jgi:hypothetical protein
MVFTELQTKAGRCLRQGEEGWSGGGKGLRTAMLRKAATIQTCIQISKSRKRAGGRERERERGRERKVSYLLWLKL